jgi:hypothetical protein
MDPITLALLGAGISAGGSALGGLFGKKEAAPVPQWLTPPQTEFGGMKKDLLSELLSSIKGQGAYSNLFNADQDTFNKSFVEPARARFANQTAPDIQQQFIQSGQQRGSGMENKLAQAGVDMDQLLNQQYYQFQNDAMNRQAGGLNSILGQQDPQKPVLYSGQQGAQSGGQAAMQGLGGYFGGKGFGSDLQGILDPYKKTPEPKKAGFTEDDYSDSYNLNLRS